jgi:hypothetical protein
MNRRSFVLSIFGGVAAAGLGGTAIAQAAVKALDAAPVQAGGSLDTATKAALDKTEAEFSQVVVRERVVVRRPRRYRRPVVVRRTVIRRPRRVVVRRRVIVR